MQHLICRRLAYWTTIIPLPALILSLGVSALRIGTGFDILRLLTAFLLLVCGAGYLASIVLTILCGFLSKTPKLLFPPTASLLLAALFVILLPENVREDPWRTVDVLIFIGLVIFNVAQVLSLRRLSSALLRESQYGTR
jgi:hypothetical protein